MWPRRSWCWVQGSSDFMVITWMHMQVIQQSSETHVNQVHKYCTKWETLRFALPAWNLFTQENVSRAWSQLSEGQVFGKIRVFGFYISMIFLYVSKHVTSLVIRKLQHITLISIAFEFNFEIVLDDPIMLIFWNAIEPGVAVIEIRCHKRRVSGLWWDLPINTFRLFSFAIGSSWLSVWSADVF